MRRVIITVLAFAVALALWLATVSYIHVGLGHLISLLFGVTTFLLGFVYGQRSKTKSP
jgi:hypothetical protein